MPVVASDPFAVAVGVRRGTQRPALGPGDEQVIETWADGKLAGASGRQLSMSDRSLPTGSVVLVLEYEGNPVALTLDSDAPIFDPTFTGKHADAIRRAVDAAFSARGQGPGRDARSHETFARFVADRTF